jgi:hypothetical protein
MTTKSEQVFSLEELQQVLQKLDRLLSFLKKLEKV